MESILNGRKRQKTEEISNSTNEDLQEAVKKCIILSNVIYKFNSVFLILIIIFPLMLQIQIQPPLIDKLQKEVAFLKKKLLKIQDSLYGQIVELKEKLLDKEKDFEDLKKLYNEVQREFTAYKELTGKVLGDDQLECLSGKKVKVWSDETIQKSIITRHLGGENMLRFSRKALIPLCAPSTLYKIVQQLKFNPGIIYFNLEVLKQLVENLEPHQKIGDIKFDEKSIIQGELFDASSKKWIGCTTLPESTSHAKNVTVFLLTLMSVRIKIVVGYHFTNSSTNGTVMMNFLFSLICEVENKCGVKINMFGSDMSPSNVSLLKAMNISTSKGSRQNFVTHPNDKDRKLKANLDVVHHLKNLVNGIRNHKVIIPKNIVEKYNLSSSIAKLSDVEKLFKKQQKMIYKPAPALKYETINPDHFERMQEKTAYNLISDEVTAALQYIMSPNLSSKSAEDILNSNIKINPTAWILSFFNKLANILLRVKWTIDNFESHADWLTNEGIPILESFKFEDANLKCIPGFVLSILSTIDFVRELFQAGMQEICPEWLSNNSIENLFSQIVRLKQKPSALHVIQAIKSLSLTKFMQDPVPNSNYNYSFTNVSTCGAFLKLLKEHAKDTNEAASSHERNLDVNNIDIPNVISWNHIFKDKLEFNSFVYSIMEIIEKFNQKISCDRCKSKLLVLVNSVNDGNQLLLLKSKQMFEPSNDVLEFFMVMEFIFQIMETSGYEIRESSFASAFTNVVLHRVTAEFEHCTANLIILIQFFVKYRCYIELKCRHIHRRDKHASKVN